MTSPAPDGSLTSVEQAQAPALGSPARRPGAGGLPRRVLDLCCSEGGAAMGYHLAWPEAEIVGVDIKAQRRYPFTFVQGDCLTFPLDGFDFIHVSTPCQFYSVTRFTHNKIYPDLIGPMRERLQAWGGPWVMENVVGAPLIEPTTLCGSSFGLTAVDDDGRPLVLKRHRLFETSYPVMGQPCQCAAYRRRGFMVGGVYGGGPSNRKKTAWKNSEVRRGGYTPKQHVRADLMGIDWMTQHGLCESIPPAYTRYLAEQFSFVSAAA